MSTIKQFTSLASGQINIGIYVLGGQGELLTSINAEWIKRKENSESNYKKAYEMYLKRKDIKGARAFDCSGLVGWALVECGAKEKGFDTTANGFYKSYTTAISKHDLRDGDLCFKVKDGKAHHVGVYVGGKIIEAKGRAYGVVSSSLTSSWDKFGRLKVFEGEVPKAYVLTRVLKKGMGSKSNPDADVKQLQTRLKELGYPFPESKGGIDGIFGSWTDKMVRQFQTDKRIGIDGKVGKQTAEKLGWVWK